jgi:hypothetical protein
VVETVAVGAVTKKRAPPKPRNLAAKALRSEPQFRPKRVEDKRKRASKRACRSSKGEGNGH